MALDDDIRILSGVRLFEGFTGEQLRLLAFGAEPVALPSGRLLYAEGDSADAAFVVVRGRIDLHRTEDGKRRAAGTALPGVILGGIALIAETQRLTAATAAADSDLLRLSRKVFRRILEEYPQVAVLLHRRISDEFLSMVREIEALEARFGG
jgi:CRP-like cAMP-binding protein